MIVHRRALCVLLLLLLAALPLQARAGDRDRLRQAALEAVNADRAAHDLAPLRLTEPLNAAAQAHAEDMLRRGYFAHAAPDGRTARDRYLGQGGSSWLLVAENIARCETCEVPPDVARVAKMQQGWMDSPEHRRNILARGFDRFGFGIAGRDGRIYAVQTFAGPGSPLPADAGGAAGRKPQEIPAAIAADLALQQVNAARQAAGLRELQASAILDTVAQALMPGEDGRLHPPAGGLWSALPGAERHRWAELLVASAGCSGCGSAVTDTDIRNFAGLWLQSANDGDTLLQPGLTHLGFAVHAPGEGRKMAVFVGGRRR